MIESNAPTAKEESAYQRYITSIQADPASIVKHHKQTGKKALLTDYIFSGKGMSSFLDVMARLSQKQGVIGDFADSFQIVTIGSLDYMEKMGRLVDEGDAPQVVMPPNLARHALSKPPENLWNTYRIPQKFYDMYYPMFMEMLINENTNECRSSYYPHTAWTIYRPDRFKTGLIRDMSKVKALLETTDISHKNVSDFSLPMADYRNLLNFRILDALNARGLLKVIR